MNIAKQRLELAIAWVKFCEAFDSDRRSNAFSVTPQASRAASKIQWHVERVRKHSLVDLETVNVERIKIFEKCESKVQKLIRYLRPESESAKTAKALLDVVAASKKRACA